MLSACTITMLKVMSSKQLLISLVRPHHEYRCAVWDSYTLKDKRTLEQFQKFACKIASKHWDAGYKDLLEWVDLPRSYLKLCLLFKITHGLCHFPTEIFTSGHISHNFRMHSCNYISRLHELMQIQFCLILHKVYLWTVA